MIIRRQKTEDRRQKTSQNRGFTIIEILIVLAIAGLILTMVFIAVPQLQRNTRDNQRQNVASRLSSELNAYSSNNQGAFPFAGVPGATGGTLCNTQAASAKNCGDWFGRYINGGKVNIKDPTTGSDENIYYTASVGPFTWVGGKVVISVGNKCDGETATAGGGGADNSKQYALLIALERTNTWYCIDNG